MVPKCCFSFEKGAEELLLTFMGPFLPFIIFTKKFELIIHDCFLKTDELETNSKMKYIRDMYRGTSEFKKGSRDRTNIVKV